ncbi:hypothetical protein [Klugiella xanthotipulae]|uniref:hypothetical protein n=1 Tax=Klugiella xanthotipulae TaxID=244735 RepID=UPI0014775B87|nr:hypothetical protein [Klugiella xanthotipulae]
MSPRIVSAGAKIAAISTFYVIATAATIFIGVLANGATAANVVPLSSAKRPRRTVRATRRKR